MCGVVTILAKVLIRGEICTLGRNPAGFSRCPIGRQREKPDRSRPDGWQTAMMQDGTDQVGRCEMAMKARYTVVNGEIIAENRNGVRSLYVPDPLGSTVALLDNTQTQTDTFSYWPYGEVNNRTGTNPTPFQFLGTAGYFTDSSTRDYVQARTLNTQQGRWMTKDPIGFDGGDWNLYRYVENRPIAAVDPSGQFSCWCCLAAIEVPEIALLCLLFCGKGHRLIKRPIPPGPYKTYRCSTTCPCAGDPACSANHDGEGEDKDKLTACNLAKKDAASKCVRPCAVKHCQPCTCTYR